MKIKKLRKSLNYMMVPPIYRLRTKVNLYIYIERANTNTNTHTHTPV